jgi:hypothetical protein
MIFGTSSPTHISPISIINTNFIHLTCNSNISSLHSLCLYPNPSQVVKSALIDTNEMKVGEFQSAINVTPNAYTRFMGQNGPDKGAESSVYLAAWVFFKKRELRGVKLPSTSAKKGEKESVPSVDGIVLEGEVDDKVPVYGEFRNPNSMWMQGISGSRYMRRRAP